MRNVKLNPEHYDACSVFLFELANHSLAQDQEVGKVLVQFLSFIASKRHSPMLILKYLALDCSNFIYLNQDDSSVILFQIK